VLIKTVLGRTGKTQRSDTPVGVISAETAVRFFFIFKVVIGTLLRGRCKGKDFSANGLKIFLLRLLFRGGAG
jgi:hypothetical protein